MNASLAVRVRAWFVLLLLALAGAAQAARGDNWTLVDLGVPAGTEASTGLSFNNRGDVVGHALFRFGTSATTWSHPFVWQNGTWIDLMPASEPFMQSGIAPAVSANGTVAVQISGRVYTWRDGVMSQVPINGVARDMNNRGTIVGSASSSFFSTAFVFENGVLFDLGTLGGHHSEAMAINNGGVVVGHADLANFTHHAFVYANGTMRDIGTLGGAGSIALDVNDRGTVVGSAQDASGRAFPFIWDEKEGMRALVNEFGSATAINNRGDIVGLTGFPTRPFLISDGAFIRLDELPALRAAGYTGFQPEDINERGMIVGTAFGPGRNAHAVVLVPK